MRIAQLSSMTGYYGGEVHLAALAAGMCARGHEVHVVVRPGSALAERLTSTGIAVTTLPLVDWYEPLGTARLAAWLRRHRIEVLHTHTPRDWYTAAVATLGTATANVGTRHRLDPVGRARFKRPFLDRFAALLAVSEAVRSSLLASAVMAPERVLTVRHGIEPPAAAPDRNEARRRLGLAADAEVVGFVGRLSPDKGLPVLLAATALLRPRRPRLQVAIIGDDERNSGHGRRLRAGVVAAGLDGVVHFLGYRPDAAELGEGFDLQAVPSLAEPFGLVVLEAMAQGVPLVATDAGGIPEIVRHGRDGLLVAPGDAAALAGALEQLLADPELGARLAAAAFRRVRADFATAGMLDAIEAVYRRALREQSPLLSPASSARPAPRHR